MARVTVRRQLSQGPPAQGTASERLQGAPLDHGEVGRNDGGVGGRRGTGKCGLEGLIGALLSPLPHPRLEVTLVPWGLALTLEHSGTNPRPISPGGSLLSVSPCSLGVLLFPLPLLGEQSTRRLGKELHNPGGTGGGGGWLAGGFLNTHAAK